MSNTNNWDALPEILKVAEVAKLLRLPKSAIYAAIRLGVLPAVNAGTRRTRIARATLEKIFSVGLGNGGPTAAFDHASETQ